MNAGHSVPTVAIDTVVTKAQVIVINAHLGSGVIYAMKAVSLNIVLVLDAFNPMELVSHVLHHTGDQHANLLATMNTVQHATK